MDPQQVINELESQIQAVPENYGVVLGDELFNELRNRGKITVEEFTALGIPDLWPIHQDAYKGSHAAWRRIDLGPWDFQVAGNEVFRAEGS